MDDSATTVSVVIPVKDDAARLRRCLRALRLQTRPPDEIVVVDNASADASAAVAAAAGAVLARCGQPGIPAAATHGYDRASGDLILRLDADCVPPATWVETMVAAAARHPEVAAFTGGARFIDGPRRLRMPLATAYLGAYAVVGMLALGHPPLFGSNLAIRRAAWLGVRGEVHRDDAGLHDDLDLAFHLGERHRIRYLPAAGMGISMRPFTDPRGGAVRVGRGVRTVLRHWPYDFPPLRWNRRVIRRVIRRLMRRAAVMQRGGGRHPVQVPG